MANDRSERAQEDFEVQSLLLRYKIKPTEARALVRSFRHDQQRLESEAAKLQSDAFWRGKE